MVAESLPTPCLIIDAQVVRQNLRGLSEYGAQHRIHVRPHTKTHKSLRVAAMQIEAGAAGLTTAKVGEAEVMAGVCDDLLVAFPAIDLHRRERVANLAGDRTIRVAVDSCEAVEAISNTAHARGVTVGLLVDLDVGLGRTGVAAPQEALSIAQRIEQARGVRLDGIMIYPGHVWARPEEQLAHLSSVAEIVHRTLELWCRSGLAATIISGGSTPTARQSHFIPRLTEIRPGTYVFNDMNTVRGGFCAVEDCAARVIASVVSTAVRGQVVLDAGSKVLTSDQCVPAPNSGYGYVVEYPDARVHRLSEEHAQLYVTGCSKTPCIGERVTVIPNHICPCINLQDQVWWLESDGSCRPMPVDARGRVS